MAADAPRFFNVWLVQPNTVYRGVPYTVVCDWIQEGRLLGRDCVRTPGAPAWEYLDAHPLFQPYFTNDGLPRAEDAAEALDKIEMDFEPVYPKVDEGDEDVDMIPLIDISMVLLVFFMMTAQNLVTAVPFSIPQAKNVMMYDSAGNIIVTVRADPDQQNSLVYHFKENYKDKYTEAEVIDLVKKEKEKRGTELKVLLQVQGNIPFEKVQTLMVGLENLGIRRIPAKVQSKAGEGGAAS
jgi:biopolymer transport protein ExbD